MITEIFSFDLKKKQLSFRHLGLSCFFKWSQLLFICDQSNHFAFCIRRLSFCNYHGKKIARFLSRDWEESSGQTKGDLETIIFTRKQKLAEVELEIERVVSKGYILTPNNFKQKF